MPARRPSKRNSACRHRKSAPADPDPPEPPQRLPDFDTHSAAAVDLPWQDFRCAAGFSRPPAWQAQFEIELAATNSPCGSCGGPQRRLALSGLQLPHPALPPLCGLPAGFFQPRRIGWVFGPITEAPEGIPPSPSYTYTLHRNPSSYSSAKSFASAPHFFPHGPLCTHTLFSSSPASVHTHHTGIIFCNS
jgi:hypothetical protein